MARRLGLPGARSPDVCPISGVQCNDLGTSADVLHEMSSAGTVLMALALYLPGHGVFGVLVPCFWVGPGD